MEITFHVILEIGVKFCLNSRRLLIQAALGNWILLKTKYLQ